MTDNPLLTGKQPRKKFANEAERQAWMAETIARWNGDMERRDIRWTIRNGSFALEWK